MTPHLQKQIHTNSLPLSMQFSSISSHKVSRIGLGLAALGRPGYITLGHHHDLPQGKSKADMEAHCHEMLQKAYSSGIRYFDTARGYGLGEQFLATWSSDNKDDLIIGSKWGYRYTADWRTDAESHEVKDLSLAHFEKQLVESKSILKQQLNIYHIHSATLESGVLEDKELIDALWQLKQTGITVGLSVSGVHQAETIQKAFSIRRNNELLFESVQVTFNILEQSCKTVLEKVQPHGMGVIIKEAVANGRLTERNTLLTNHPSLLAICQKHQCSLDALAMAFVLHHPWADVVLSGASTIAQLESNISAQNIQLDTEDLQKLNELVEDKTDYWKTRSSLVWN